MIDEGEPFPDFHLPVDGGGTISREQMLGRPFVVYLYPKDDTSGCTKEALAFSESMPRFEELGIGLFGVSKDTIQSHDNFKAKHGLALTLASDEDGRLIEQLGAWVEKNMYGKKYMGVDRSTFLVDADGTTARIWRKVKVPGHVDKVLDAASDLARSEEKSV